MRAYLEGKTSGGVAPQLTLIFMAVLTVLGFLLAEQILTGWVALGERANISRRDYNFIEIFVAIFSFVWGIAGLRTVWGIFKREIASYRWAQWISFLTFILGIAFLLNAVLPQLVEAFTNEFFAVADIDWFESRLGNIPTLILGILFFISGMAVYQYLTEDVVFDDAKVDKSQGALSTASSDMPPASFIRFQLAKSPSAGAIIGFVVILFAFTVITPLFFQPTSIASILTNISTKGIIAIGVALLMISGEFDLSVGSTLGAVSLFFMLFITEGIPQIGIGPMPTMVGVVVALFVACILGLINGLILIRTGIPSFIVTLGTLLAYRAMPLVLIPGGRILRYRDYYDAFPVLTINRFVMVILAVAGLGLLLYTAYRSLPGFWQTVNQKWQNQHDNGDFGTTQAIVSTGLVITFAIVLLIVGLWLVMVTMYHLDNSGEALQVGYFDIANGRWAFTFNEVSNGLFSLTIPREANFRNSIIWWLALVGFFHVVLTRTSYGNAVFAVGGNPGAARAQGIDVDRIKVFNFVLLAFLVGIAAILEVARNPGVDPLKGDGWELEVIAMTVIGGALLSGGYGSIVGTMLGALIFGMLQTGLVIIGMNARLFQGVIGVVLIVAVVLNTAVRGRSSR